VEGRSPLVSFVKRAATWSIGPPTGASVKPRFVDKPSLTQSTYLSYDTLPIVQSPPRDLANPGIRNQSGSPGARGTTFGTEAQRVDENAADLTRSAFASHRVPTPGHYKQYRAPARRFGPGAESNSYERRFKPSSSLTGTAFSQRPPTNLSVYKTRHPTPIFLPERSRTSSSLRNSVMDARMEMMACAQIMVG